MAKADIKKSKKSVSKKQEEKAVKQKKEESSSSSSSSSESSSSESESGSDSDSSSSDEEAEKKDESSSDSSDSGSESGSSSDEEEEEEKKESSSSSSSSSESSSSDEEDEKKDEKKDDSSSSSESESDSSESDEEAENPKKRKAESEEADSTSASPEPEAKKAKTEDEPATLFVGRLSWNIDDDWLKREFEAYPGLLGARVISDRQSGRSKGYGYVDFESKEVAEKALEEMQGKEIDGRPINVDLSTSKPKATDRSNDRAKKFGDAKSEPSDTLFIGNLSFDCDRDSVTEFFSEYGPILGVRLPTHPETEQLKGFGYIQFESVDSAQKALDNLNGEYLNNRSVRLDFSTPKPQNDGGRSFGGRGGRGGRGGFGGRDRNGGNGGRGGFRSSGSGANSTPVAFRGNKKTFD